MRKFILSVGIVSMFVGFTATAVLSAAAPDKIKFPYSPISWNSLPWWMAKDAGHFEKNGLDVELFYEGASSVIVQAMLAGDGQFSGIAGPSIVSNVYKRRRRDPDCRGGEDIYRSDVRTAADQIRGRA